MKNELLLLLFLSLSLVLSGFAGSRGDEVVFRLTTSFKGVDYESKITERDLAGNPEWNESSENPPLEPKRAERAAFEYVRKNLLDGNWTTEIISLKPVGGKHWLYIVELMPPLPQKGFNGLMLPVKVIVLMKGTAMPLIQKA